MAKTNQVYLSIFALRPSLRLEVERSGTIGTGDIINQAAITCTEKEPPQGHLKTSDRFRPSHKCPFRESVNSVENSCSICFREWSLSKALNAVGLGWRLGHIKILPISRIFIWIRAKGSQSSEGWDKIMKEHLWKVVHVPGYGFKNFTWSYFIAGTVTMK